MKTRGGKTSVRFVQTVMGPLCATAGATSRPAKTKGTKGLIGTSINAEAPTDEQESTRTDPQTGLQVRV